MVWGLLQKTVVTPVIGSHLFTVILTFRLSTLLDIILTFFIQKLFIISFCVSLVAVAVRATTTASGNMALSLDTFLYSGRNSCPHWTIQWASSIMICLTDFHSACRRIAHTSLDRTCSRCRMTYICSPFWKRFAVSVTPVTTKVNRIW